MRIASILLLAAGAGAVVWYFTPPASGTPAQLKVERTEARVARGHYLFSLAACNSCHLARDFSHFAGPPLDPAQHPEAPHAPNLTADPQTGLGRWTDAEIVRAIREGIGRDGKPLDPAMPYQLYRQLSDEDVFALTAYIRTLSPVACPLARAAAGLTSLLQRRAGVQAVPHVEKVDPNDRVRYGEYLATAARCIDCHTRPDGGNMGAGGRIFHIPGAVVASANLTPSASAGIGRWSEQDFLDRFLQYRSYAEKGAPAVGPEGFTVMPWLELSQLAPDDLRAIFAYLRTLPPSSAEVTTHPVNDKATLMRLRKNF